MSRRVPILPLPAGVPELPEGYFWRVYKVDYDYFTEYGAEIRKWKNAKRKRSYGYASKTISSDQFVDQAHKDDHRPLGVPSDVMYRGDELVVVLCETAFENHREILEKVRLRREFAQTFDPYVGDHVDPDA